MDYQNLDHYQQQQQHHHHHDVQGSLVPAVSGAGQIPAQMIHRPGYAQREQQPLAMPSTKEMETRPTQPGQEPEKKRPPNNVKPRPTASETPNVASLPIVDRVRSNKERRRTQMRIAQRAYRLRKQNELSSRAKQLLERDDVIARMKTAFDSLQLRLASANILSICPDVEQTICEMERGFETLRQMAGENAPAAAAAASVPAMENGQVDGSVLNIGGVDPSQQRQWTSSDFGSDSSDLFDPLSRASYQAHGATGPAHQSDLHHQYPNTYQQYTSRTIPTTTRNGISLPTPAYISPPTSYSFQETTFARRLMRICAERAHGILINGGLTTLSPNEARVFKLAYRIWSRDYLLEKFQMVLTGAVDLYDPSVPFLSLGGAGTHYLKFRESPPPISAFSSSSSNYAQNRHYQPPHVTSGSVTSGPLTTHTAHIRPDGPDTSLTGIVSSLGLLNDGSDWFDVQDIDGYLQDMGIRLEPHSTTYRFSIPANPEIASRRMMMNQNPLASVIDQSGENIMGGAHEYVPAYVDVEKFINSLTSKAMCLGRAPGFRKKDVEEQFYNSIEVLSS